MQKVICISESKYPHHRGVKIGEVYFIDTSSIYGNSDGDWYAEVSKDETMTMYIGRMNLKHFKTAT